MLNVYNTLLTLIFEIIFFMIFILGLLFFMLFFFHCVIAFLCQITTKRTHRKQRESNKIYKHNIKKTEKFNFFFHYLLKI